MNPQICKTIRKRYIQEQFGSGDITPRRCTRKTITHYNTQGEPFCEYNYCGDAIYKTIWKRDALQDDNADYRTYDVVEQKKDNLEQIIYEKWIFHPAVGWESNYILYAHDLQIEEIVVFGTKEFFFQYDDAHRHIQTNVTAVFRYFKCDNQGCPVLPNQPEAIVTIAEKFMHNTCGNLIFEQQVIDYSNASKYREETEREFRYDVIGNMVRCNEIIRNYNHRGDIEYIQWQFICDRIIYH